MSNLFSYELKTNKSDELINISSYVVKAVNESKVKEGIAIIFNPHTTAAITINENADPDVQRDIVYGMNKVFPDDVNFKHFEGNSSSHLKTSTFGSSETIIISNGELLLGTWQGIYFCEFDGPRSRKFHVKIMEG